MGWLWKGSTVPRYCLGSSHNNSDLFVKNIFCPLQCTDSWDLHKMYQICHQKDILNIYNFVYCLSVNSLKWRLWNDCINLDIIDCPPDLSHYSSKHDIISIMGPSLTSLDSNNKRYWSVKITTRTQLRRTDMWRMWWPCTSDDDHDDITHVHHFMREHWSLS